MKKNVNQKELILMIYKNLMGVLKNKKLYHIFRCNVGNGVDNLSIRYSTFYTFYHIKKRHGCDFNPFSSKPINNNPFDCVKNLNELFNKMIEINDANDEDIPLMNSKKLQMLILQNINNLLHYCVENYVLDFSLLNEIGKETFDRTCYKLFGEKFVDITCDDIPDKTKTIMEAQMEFLSSPQGRGFRPDGLGANKKFLEFLKRKGLLDTPSTRDIELVPFDGDRRSIPSPPAWIEL